MGRTRLHRWWPVAALAVGLAVAGCGTAPPPRTDAAPATTAAPAAPAGAAPSAGSNGTGSNGTGSNGTGPTRRAAPGEAVDAVPPDFPADFPADFPPDFPLPDEGGRSTSPETTDWVTETGTDRTWLLDPCSPTTYPTDARRAVFKTVSQTGPEWQAARQLAVYPSPEVAAEVMEGFRRALAACSTGTTREGSRWEWVTREAPALGDDGLLAASTEGGPGFAPAGDRVAVTRVGSAVFMAFSSGESSTAEIDGAAEQVQQVAQQFLDSV